MYKYIFLIGRDVDAGELREDIPDINLSKCYLSLVLFFYIVM